MTSVEKNKIINELETQFENHRVEYLGYNRFVCCDKIKTTDMDSWTKIILFDEKCNQISLSNEYDEIFPYTNGVAVVGLRSDLIININATIRQECKKGLIDTLGKELLLCNYDKIKVGLDGNVELTKNVHRKKTSIITIINGKFNWDEA